MSDQPAMNMEDWAKGIPLAAGDWAFGIWQPSPEAADFWKGVAKRELLLKHCAGCGLLQHPKRIICTACGSEDLGWQRAAGTGKAYSFSEIHRPPTPMFEPSVPARMLVPMAIALGYGVLFASVVTLFLVPSAYVILDDLVKLTKRPRRSRNTVAPERDSLTQAS